MPTPTVTALLTVSETATTLRVDKSTVLRWVRTGELPVVRIAGTLRIPSTALTPTRKEPSQ